ncbi:MAG: methyltransferase domain-containing protein [Planctomycetes bacterium]|nr:methyltransferase domain-containing protein [Planctomycetota bacterium]
MSIDEPTPLPRPALERALAKLARGSPYRAAFESLLLELDDEAADRLMQLSREARGAWFLALCTPDLERGPARALCIGNALSGASIPLAAHGFEVTLFDRSPLRLRFAQARNAALVPGGSTETVVAQTSARLPFEAGAFDLVVQEDALDAPAHELDELARVCRGEVVLIADNRLAYKRSTGRRGVFDVPSPLAFARRALRGPGRTLGGYRKRLERSGIARPRCFALYPHASEFTFLVGLDAAGPRLELGPKERANSLKLLAHSLGLFPWLTPSFALIGTRGESSGAAPRWSRLLAAIERATGERGAELEHVVATRGNSAVLLTRGARDHAAGAWCVHIGLSAAQRDQLSTHARTLQHIASAHPACPVPQFLLEGVHEGVYVTVERRARGLTAPQLTGELAATRRTLEDLVPALEGLVASAPRELDGACFERLLGARFDIVSRTCASEATRAALEHLRATAREQWIGLRFPLVVQHADLRSKHVQVERDGRLVALLDFGSAERADLPGFDLLHHMLHERKQAERLSSRAMWRLALEPRHWRDFERAALERYAAALALPEGYFAALARVYPVLVAAMAERHWDYSRPRWLERQFGVGAERET